MTVIPTESMLQHLSQLQRSLKDMRVGVLGLGVSGKAMALYLQRRGAHVLAVDDNLTLDTKALQQANIEVLLGPVAPQTFADVTALALSPGVDPKHPAVQAVLQSGRPVLGELELVGQLPTPVLAITGTNGKSTTTALCGELLQSCGRRVFVGGNFGTPVTTWLDSQESCDEMVLEVSSYQLDTAYHFASQVGVVLNVTPDHLSRYGSMQAYAAAKERLVSMVKPTGFMVLNADDTYVRAMAKSSQAQVLWFSRTAKTLPGDGLTLVDQCLQGHGSLRSFGCQRLEHPYLLGQHNQENALAAFLAMYGLGVAKTAQDLWPGYLAFRGLPHRLEHVGQVHGVDYINDSKATNDASAALGLLAMQQPVVLLVGGQDKGGGYAALLQAAKQRQIRSFVAFGQAADLIMSECLGAGMPVAAATGLMEACALAQTLAKKGDAVLLSPACASFDEFQNYGQRGNCFKSWVQGLIA